MHRLDKVPHSAEDDTHNPHSIFKCVSCELCFHGDCARLGKGEKRLAQKISAVNMQTESLQALCWRCAQTSKVVWHAAIRDACRVTNVLATVAASKLKKAQVLDLAKKERDGRHLS
jgi:hypothetical protein